MIDWKFILVEKLAPIQTIWTEKGAFHAGGRVMIIETEAAIRLMNQYFKNIEI